jgi:site-specific DNA-methyltransferase (adenine-specific)
MSYIPDEYVDLTVTSPPYDSLRLFKGCAWSFPDVARALWRITRPGGVLVWVVGDSVVNGSETGTAFQHALEFKEIGFRLHDTMIYQKANYMPAGPSERRYAQAFEYMFVFSKGAPKAFHPISVQAKGRLQAAGFARYEKDGTLRQKSRTHLEPVFEKRAGNIWTYGVGQSHTGHPAIFPLQLAIDHIVSWSNPGDLILDPFMGAGTTALACVQTGRNYLGFDVSSEYCDIAKKRIEQIQIVGKQYRPGVRQREGDEKWQKSPVA